MAGSRGEMHSHFTLSSNQRLELCEQMLKLVSFCLCLSVALLSLSRLQLEVCHLHTAAVSVCMCESVCAGALGVRVSHRNKLLWFITRSARRLRVRPAGSPMARERGGLTHRQKDGRLVPGRTDGARKKPR